MKWPFGKKDKEVTNSSLEIDVSSPTITGEKDVPQVNVANATYDTKRQTSLESVLMDNILQMGKSTPPANSFSPTPTNYVYSTPYTEFLNQGMVGPASTNLAWSIVSYLKAFFVNRFEYTGLEVDYLILEEKLFLYGRVCIYKIVDKYYVLPFNVDEYDLNGQPLKITPFFPKGDKVPLTQIKEKAIHIDSIPWFQNDMAGIWNSNPSYSPIMRHWYQVQKAVSLRTLIDNNAVLASPRFIFNTRGMSELEVSKFDAQFRSGSLILYADLDGTDVKMLEGIVGAENGLVDLLDRTDTLWLNYDKTLDELKTFVGARTNAGNTSKKERMVNDEINVENSTTKTALRVEEELRVQGCERCNKIYGWNSSVKCFEVEEAVENDKYNNDKRDLKKGVENV